MKPYYQDSRVTLYRGDCRKVLPGLAEKYTSIITDPVWPNCGPIKGRVKGTRNPERLLKEALEAARIVKRVVIHLGANSDPRFLAAVPGRYEFKRVCWLRYSRPSYSGMYLRDSDVAYVFGEWARKRESGQRVYGGGPPFEICETHQGDKIKHPCPRRYTHVQWLVKCFGSELILDPFAGSGTTLLAAKNYGVKAVGIEKEKKWCDVVVDRLKQNVFEWPEQKGV